MAGKIPLTFKIFKGDQLLRTETLSQPVIKVGKLSSSHLRLDDETVSRMHAVIEVTGPNDISIIDLGSTKGTFVNGQKVNKAKLQSGDTVTLGDTRIEVAIGVEEAADADDEPTKVQGQTAQPVEDVIASTPRPVTGPAPAIPPAPPMSAGMAPTLGGGAPPPMPPARAAAPIAPPPGMPGILPPPGMPGSSGMGAMAPSQFGMTADIDDMTGARAVECAAMLGDSVVGVKHVMNPRGGKVSPVTWALLAGGIFLVVMAFGIFKFVGVRQAEINKKALHYHVETLKLPYHEFRPKTSGPGADFLVFGGFLGGLACMTFFLIRYRNEKVSPYFKIGRAPDVDFPTDGHTPLESWPLVAPSGDDFVVNYAQGMDGEMMVDGQSTPLSQLAGAGRARQSGTLPGAIEVPIPNKARIRLKSGHNTFLIASVNAPRKSPVPLFATISGTVLAFFGASALVHLGFVLMLEWIPPDSSSLALDLGSGEQRPTDLNSKPEEDQPEEEEELEKESDEEEGGTGTAEAFEEGKMGKEDSDRETGRYAAENKGVDPQLAKKQAIEQARTEGILGVGLQEQLTTLTGSADFTSGLDDRTVFGGRLGDEVGEMAGGFGTGASGFGPGGGGTGWGTIGSGRYGTIGHGSGTGEGYGSGKGRGGLSGRRSVVPQVHIGNATATGDLDKNIIRRYIRRQLARIKYCYEKQLLVNQGLQGTVVTNFVINGDGSVSNSKAGGVNGDVSSCVADVISSIQFPKPKGGGIVQVRYPFNFRPTGE
jgi:hypothetical protein